MLNGYSTESPQLNGHSPADEKRLDGSLEDLVREVEACDAPTIQAEPTADQPQVEEEEVQVTLKKRDSEDVMAALEILDSDVRPREAEAEVAAERGTENVDREEASVGSAHEMHAGTEDPDEALGREEERTVEDPEQMDGGQEARGEQEEKSEGSEDVMGNEEGEGDRLKREEKELKAFEVKPTRKSKLRSSFSKLKRKPKKESADKSGARGEDAVEGGEKETGEAEEGEGRTKEQGEEQAGEKDEQEPEPDEPKPKRRSLLKLKRRPKSMHAAEKTERAAGKSELRSSDPCLATEGATAQEGGAEEAKGEGEEKAAATAGEEEGQTEEQAEPAEAKEQPKPKLRSRLKIARRRPASMAVADRKQAENGDHFRRDDTARHSYHAGDLSEPSGLSEFGRRQWRLLLSLWSKTAGKRGDGPGEVQGELSLYPVLWSPTQPPSFRSWSNGPVCSRLCSTV